MAVAAFTKHSNKAIPKLDGFKPSSLGHDTDAMESAERFIVLNLARDLSQEHRPEACAPSGHFVRLPFCAQRSPTPLGAQTGKSVFRCNSRAATASPLYRILWRSPRLL